ncbi:MAG: hypothetical protein IKL97_00380, partial [Eggerthellaceae bacterium]|nr:hypothetical protein [Eggerthellaceae bacterium]
LAFYYESRAAPCGTMTPGNHTMPFRVVSPALSALSARSVRMVRKVRTVRMVLAYLRQRFYAKEDHV